MDPFELAAKLRQVRTIQSELGSSEQVSRLGSVQVVSGVAESDSSGGYVMVNLGGSSVTQDGTQAVECASDVSVRAGQEVQVQIADGKPRVTGVIGWGDAIRVDVDLAATQAADAETLATEAKEAVEAVSQHFWYDSNGAHVSTEAGVADGARNSLWNSLGIFFRSAANYLVGITQSAVQFYDGLGNAAANIMASFGATGARIGYAAKAHVAIDADSVDFNDGSKTLASVVNSDGMAGIVIPNSGAVIGGTSSEPALWIKRTNSNGRIAIGSGKGRPTLEELQITNNLIYMRGASSPNAVSFDLSSSGNGAITSQGRITGAGLTSNGDDSIRANITAFDSTAANPSASQTTHGLLVYDSAGVIVGQLRVGRTTDGKIGIALVARQGTTASGGIKQNAFWIYTATDGTVSYSVPTPANFRSAIASASLAANTFSGAQTVNGNQIVGKSTNLTSNTAPSAATNGNGTFRLTDSANNTIGYICPHFGTDNIQWFTMYAQRAVSGTNRFCTLRLGIDSSGNARVAFEGLKVRQAWNSALRQVLYNSTTGTNGNVTLSETAANFNHLTIYYRTNDNFHSSVDVFAPNGKIVSLQSIGINNAGNNMYLKSRTVTINGTSITKNGEGSAVLWSASTGYPSASTDIYITRVEGW